MRRWLRQLDGLLRGEATRLPALSRGVIEVPTGGMSLVIVVLGLLYGVCMGCYALFRAGGPFGQQFLASTVKVPALFLLTLVVTFPSLYVFNALVGSRLLVRSVLRLLIAAMAVTLAVLASLGTIVAFFSVCTTSYPFMVLLNVVVFAVAGALGLKFLLQTLHRLSVAEAFSQPPPPAEPSDSPPDADPPDTDAPDADEANGGAPGPDAPKDQPVEVRPISPEGPLEPMAGRVLGGHVKTVFRCWVIVFGLVGAQMGWVLRPFIGNPGQPFTWFRPRESNFFEAVFHTIIRLFS